MVTGIIVGSGPNGLAAALTLARAGVDVTVLEAADTPGGGTRTVEATLPGLLHDECSGFHPLVVDNAFTRAAGLDAYGLEWAWPAVQYAHPLDQGTGAAAWRSVDETARQLFDDGRAWRAVFAPLAREFPDIAQDFLRPLLNIPRHPGKLVHFGLFAGMPASLVADIWHSPQARALFAGIAAHAFRPFGTLLSSAIGMALGTAAHTYGWPVARGGSASISRALLAALAAHGGKVETGVVVKSAGEVAAADIVMFDTSPLAAAQILGDALPGTVARGLRAFKHGPGAFAMSFAVEGGVPWQYEPARHAGTVHLGGTFEQIARAERAVGRGRLPERPFVLLGQQYLVDDSRSAGAIHPIDAYAHVPAGFTGDASGLIEDQIERFAPGFRDRVVARHVRSPAQLQAANPNYIGGDIVTGANSAMQLVFRPRPTLHPYALGVPGRYICSAATPPGAGAHGMAGFHAANAALRELERGGNLGSGGRRGRLGRQGSRGSGGRA